MNAIRTIVVALCLVGFAAPVFADSCPYCGRVYGDAAPGDEARIDALRRDHEYNCPDNPANRPQPARGYDDSDGYDSGSYPAEPEATGYGVITIFNASQITVGFQIRATASGNWKTGSIAPGAYYWYWQTESASFSISFDWSFAEGVQERIYDLPHNTVAANPKFSDGREYVFIDGSNGIDLSTSTGRITARVQWDRENAERLRREQLRLENERFRAKIDNAMYNAMRYEEREDYKLALQWYRYAEKFFPPPPNIWMTDPGIRAHIIAADQKLRRQKGCNETHAKALAAYERKEYATALRYWQEAQLYCSNPQIIEGWINKARDGKRNYDEMLALNEAGNALWAKKDAIGAYRSYKQALEKTDNLQVKANLARAANECTRRSNAANDSGNAILARDKFAAAVAYIVALQSVVNPQYEKTILANLNRALAGLSLEELDRLDQMSGDEIAGLYAARMSGKASSAGSAAGNREPNRQASANQSTDNPDSGDKVSSADGSGGASNRSQLSDIKVDRIKKNINEKVLGGINWDGRGKSGD